MTFSLFLVVSLGFGAAGVMSLARGGEGSPGSSDSATGDDPGRIDGASRSAATGRVPAVALSLGLPDRIRRAGRAGILAPRSVLVAKAGGAGMGAAFGASVASLLPGRAGVLLLAGSVLSGFLAPDLLLERAARRRHRQMISALPDVLDLLAVSVSTGRSLGGGLADLAGSGRGPLIRELGEVSEDLTWGSGQAKALTGLRQRIRGPEIAALCTTLERSRRLGSPLAEQLRRQSSGLRADQRRMIEEEAARAAPKIQLVVALLLVPSVLLLIVAALIANSDMLLAPVV